MSQSVSESVNQWISQSVSQWISESVSESLNQWVSQLLSHWISESVIQCMDESVNQWLTESVSQCISESASQSISQQFSQSISWWINYAMTSKRDQFTNISDQSTKPINYQSIVISLWDLMRLKIELTIRKLFEAPCLQSVQSPTQDMKETRWATTLEGKVKHSRSYAKNHGDIATARIVCAIWRIRTVSCPLVVGQLLIHNEGSCQGPSKYDNFT